MRGENLIVYNVNFKAYQDERSSTLVSGLLFERHTYAVRQVVMRVQMAMIQSKMGHRSISTTEIYAEFELKKLKRHFPMLLDYFQEDRKQSKKTEGIALSGIANESFRAITEDKLPN